MSPRHPRRVLALLAAATIIPILVLSGLSVRLLRQQSDAERQRRSDALAAEAARIAFDVEGRLKEVEQRMAGGDGLVLTAHGLYASNVPPVLYQPDVDLSVPAPSVLRAAEATESRRGDFPAAAAEYRRVSQTRVASVRAYALLGLARVLRKANDSAGAQKALDELEAMDATPVTGVPASLVAKFARLKLLEQVKDDAGIRAAGSALARALNDGGMHVDRATFLEYSATAERAGGQPPDANAIARTEAAGQVWRTWRSGALPASGGRTVSTPSGAVLALWSPSRVAPVVWVATSVEVGRMLRPLWADEHLEVSGVSIEGQRLFGDDRPDAVLLTPGRTGLPFVLSVAPLDGFGEGAGDAFRRSTLVAIVGGSLILMTAAALGVYRAMLREFRLAQQQTDFVSAVSHEFRTPLTSMRHLLDLLTSRGVTTEEKRTHFYVLLTHETERLHRMVEALLSFGSMEAGAYAWRREAVDLASVTAGVVEEFRREELAEGRDIVCERGAPIPDIAGDSDALGLAIRNLIENAAKYSPAGLPVRVIVAPANGSICINVIDRGPGIPAGEQSRVFQKFVRGTNAHQAGVRGVGIGLAVVRQIVEAHGGTVGIESAAGHGSTFTIRLPTDAVATAGAVVVS